MTSKCETDLAIPAYGSELSFGGSGHHPGVRRFSGKRPKKNHSLYGKTNLVDVSDRHRCSFSTSKVGADQLQSKLDNHNQSWFSDSQTYVKNGVRLLKGGRKSVLDFELLELAFCDLKGETGSKEYVKRLFQEFGELNAIFSASKQRLEKTEGFTLDIFLRLKVIQAISLRMAQSKVINRQVLSCWDDLISYCRASMAQQQKEQFRVFFLDKKNFVISDEEQAEGTIDHVPVYPRELAKRALELNANALILVHNHPSGDPSPSPEDIVMTRSVQKACQAIGVLVHDHVIIGKGKEFSFKASNHL